MEVNRSYINLHAFLSYSILILILILDIHDYLAEMNTDRALVSIMMALFCKRLQIANPFLSWFCWSYSMVISILFYEKLRAGCLDSIEIE